MSKLARRILALLTAAALVCTAGAAAVFAAEGETDDVTISLMFTNDVHGRYATAENDDGTLSQFGYARLKTLVDEVGKESDAHYLFDIGDAFHGQPFASLAHGNSIARIMEAVGYEGMVMGNHDFNYGASRLSQLQRVSRMTFFGSNILDKATGKLNPLFTDYKVYKTNGVSFAVFGLATPETAYKTNPLHVQSLRFADPILTAERTVAAIEKNEDVDFIVCLAHLGTDKESGRYTSTRLAQNVEGINLILDGHSHSSPDESAVVNDTVIISAGSYMSHLGEVIVTVSSEKEQIAIDAGAYAASDFTKDDLAEDPTIAGKIKAIEKFQAASLTQTVATTPVPLNGERASVRTTETNLSRLLTDAMLAETGADIALTNGGGIRASIDQGPITAGEILNVLPFGNYIVTVKLTGSELKQAVEHGLPSMTDGKLDAMGSYIQFAGLELTYNPNAPQGSRIVTLTHKGKPVKNSDSFIVATNDFMHVGGDDYTMLKKPVVNEYSALDEALTKYIKAAGAAAITKVQDEIRVTIAE